MQIQLVGPTELLQVIIDPIELILIAAISPINFEVNQCYLEEKITQILYCTETPAETTNRKNREHLL